MERAEFIESIQSSNLGFFHIFFNEFVELVIADPSEYRKDWKFDEEIDLEEQHQEQMAVDRFLNIFFNIPVDDSKPVRIIIYLSVLDKLTKIYTDTKEQLSKSTTSTTPPTLKFFYAKFHLLNAIISFNQQNSSDKNLTFADLVTIHMVRLLQYLFNIDINGLNNIDDINILLQPVSITIESTYNKPNLFLTSDNYLQYTQIAEPHVCHRLFEQRTSGILRLYYGDTSDDVEIPNFPISDIAHTFELWFYIMRNDIDNDMVRSPILLLLNSKQHDTQ